MGRLRDRDHRVRLTPLAPGIVRVDVYRRARESVHECVGVVTVSSDRTGALLVVAGRLDRVDRKLVSRLIERAVAAHVRST